MNRSTVETERLEAKSRLDPPPPAAPSTACILLAAGGTGGHIYPAVALAEALREEAPEVAICFCCGNRPSERQLYKRLGIDPWVLPVSHHRSGFANRLRFVRQMHAAFWRARGLIRKQPVRIAVGFGGYPSVPPLLAARLSGASLAIHEQNVRPGAANRLLAPLTRLVATGLPTPEGALPADKTKLVGNPVRTSILRRMDRREARAFFRLEGDRPVCLCFGGSQGALGVNRLVLSMLGRAQTEGGSAARWRLLWSTGPTHYNEVVRALTEMGVDPAEHTINPYIDEIATAYSAADLVVARAGALTLAEIGTVGVPAVLVPLPIATGGHQAINARRLAQDGAAEIVEEADPRAAERLESLLGKWATAPELLERMADAARAQGRPHAARDLARLVLDL